MLAGVPQEGIIVPLCTVVHDGVVVFVRAMVFSIFGGGWRGLFNDFFM